MFGGALKRQREPQGYMNDNLVLDNTTVLTADPGLDPPVHLDWPGPQFTQDPSSLYPAGVPATQQLKGLSAATAAMAMSYGAGGYQQPPGEADVSTSSTMLYWRYRQDQAFVANSLHVTSNADFAGAGTEMQSSMADAAFESFSQQHHEVATAAKAQQQQKVVLLRGQQQQQLPLALARTAVGAAGLPSSRTLYSKQCNIYAAEQLQCGTSASTCSRVCAPAARLPPRPGPVTYCNPSTQSNPKSAAAVAGVLGATSTRPVLQQQMMQEQSSNMSSSSRLVQAAAGSIPAAAGAANIVGRWVGQMGFIDSPAAVPPGSAESQANNGGFGLECDELLSLETGNAFQLQQQLCGSSQAAAAVAHRQQHLVDQLSDSHEMFSPQSAQSFVEDIGSSTNSGSANELDQAMEDDWSAALVRTRMGALCHDPALDSLLLAAGKTAAVTAQEAAAAKQAAALQLLSATAQLRKGGPVLTATAPYAAAAGAKSARSRLLITEVSVYTEKGACSQLALDQANKLMGKMAFPEDITYMPVSFDSFLFRAGAAWQFPAFVICLGSSYLQRMFARLPQLAEAALACPGFEDYCQYLPEQYQATRRRYLSGPEATATLATLRSVQFTCLFIATKVADQVHAMGLLRFMLTKLSHDGAVVSLEQAADVEARCLDALGWRLGPFFMKDGLTSDDEELWAEGMGHWMYGSDRDRYPEVFC